jgi:hypothetical protein
MVNSEGSSVTSDAGIPTHRTGIKTVPLGLDRVEGRLCPEASLALLRPRGGMSGGNRAKRTQFAGGGKDAKHLWIEELQPKR